MKKQIGKLLPISTIISFLLIWEIVVILASFPAYLLPAPSVIILTTIKIIPQITNHIFATIFEAITGMLISVFVSFFLVTIMEYFPVLRKMFYPIIITSQTIPIIYLAPLFVLWFGFGFLPKIIVVILICFFPISISLLDSFINIEQSELLLFRSFSASKWNILLHLKFPSSLPNFFSSLKIAATYAMMGAIIGEWLGGEVGLGVYILRVKQSFLTDRMFAAILLITLISLLMVKFVQILERVCLPHLYISKKEKK